MTEHEVRRPRPVDWRSCTRGNPLRWTFREADWCRWQSYQPRVWRRFDRVQVFTSRDAMRAAALAPDVARRLRVNPFGVAVPAALDPRREEAHTLVFVGNYTHPPNVDAAVWLARDIFPLVRAHCPSVRLILAGSAPGPSVHALRNDHIAIAADVPSIEVLLERAGVVIAPVRTGGGQRMKVLQSMAFGKAVVTTSRGAEGLGDCGSPPPLVVADDAVAIARGVIDLIGAPALRRDLGARARAFVVQHMSPEAYAQRLEATYAEVSVP